LPRSSAIVERFEPIISFIIIWGWGKGVGFGVGLGVAFGVGFDEGFEVGFEEGFVVGFEEGFGVVFEATVGSGVVPGLRDGFGDMLTSGAAVLVGKEVTEGVEVAVDEVLEVGDEVDTCGDFVFKVNGPYCC